MYVGFLMFIDDLIVKMYTPTTNEVRTGATLLLQKVHGNKNSQTVRKKADSSTTLDNTVSA